MGSHFYHCRTLEELDELEHLGSSHGDPYYDEFESPFSAAHAEYMASRRNLFPNVSKSLLEDLDHAFIDDISQVGDVSPEGTPLPSHSSLYHMFDSLSVSDFVKLCGIFGVLFKSSIDDLAYIKELEISRGSSYNAR